jgi:hypothetical protein
LLVKQRERTTRLARYVRRQRDQHNRDADFSSTPNQNEGSFAGLLTDGVELTDEQVNRATEELVVMARMLDLLDEMLISQDYALSQTGTFSQG